MPKSVNIPGVGVVNFPDAMSNEQINSTIKTEILPKYGQAPKPSEGRGGVLPSFAEGFATGFTDIPLGIAGLFTARPEETTAGKFSTGARDVIQDILGIDPTKEATTAETAASALGSLGSYLVPGLGAVKVAKGIGMGARGAGIAGSIAGGAQGVALGTGEQAQRAMAQEQATGQKISDKTRQSAQLLGGAIGLTELLPLQRFLGPLEKILAKVPLSKAGTVSDLIQTGITRAAGSATAEGAQEAISQLAQNLVEQGAYNPDLDVTEGLLGNAAAGGFAGGTVDAILQIMAGRKIRKATTSQNELTKQLKSESTEAAPEQVRAQALDGLNTLRTAAPTGVISTVQSTMPNEASKFYIVDANKNPIASFGSADAAILAGKQYEADSGGATKFEPPTITEMVKIKTPKAPKLSKAEQNKARQEAKRLKAEGALAPAPTVAPATTPEGQATTAASIEKVVAETPVIAPKKGRKPLAPTEAVVPPEVALPAATAAEITLPETPTEAPPAAELTADERVAIWKGIAPEAQSFRDLSPDQQATYFEALKQAKPVGVKPYTGDQAKLSAAPAVAPAATPEVAATTPVAEASDVPKGYKKVETPRETAVTVAIRPLESTPEGAAKSAEMDAKKGRVADALNKVLTPIVAKDVRLNLVSYIATKPDEKGNVGYARGEVTPEGKVINLSLDIYDPALTEEQLIDKLMQVMNHEVIHTLTNAKLLNPAEIKTLFDAADKTKYQGKSFTYFDRAYDTYVNKETGIPIQGYEVRNEAGEVVLNDAGRPNVDMDAITEEAVAEMFRDYRAGKLKLNEKPKGIFNKLIQFFKRMFRGFRDAEVGKVFTRIESGEVGAREGVAATAGAATKLSAAPQEKGAAFRRLASEQRDRPESAMLDAQMALSKYPSGPALGKALESVGDLSHRMAENPENNRDSGLEIVNVKVGVGLRLASNATDIERIGAIPDLLELTAYAGEHAKLPVYNDAQRAARDAAVALGRRDFSEAEKNLLSLKSMIDNGTYVDIAGSFDPKYEGAAASTGAVAKFSVAPAVGTDEFSNWFKQSKAVNEVGGPMVYYRGDPKPLRGGELKTRRAGRDFSMSGGIPGEEGPFYFSPSTKFAETYATADNSKGGFGKPSKRGVMTPVYLSVQNPFDYENPSHVEAVATKMAQNNPLSTADLHAGFLKGGSWQEIENPSAQRAIRALGFDGFYAKEGGVKNLAVYDPRQAKSIFNQFEPGTATSKKLSVAPSAYENVPFLEKPAAAQKQILGDVERMRRKANDIAKDVSRKSETTLDDSANAANIEVRNAVRKLSVIPQPHPQSAFFEAANSTLFSTVAKPTSPGERMMDLLGGLGKSSGREKTMDAIRVNYVQSAGQVAKHKRQLEISGKIESGIAEYDAIASIEAADRSSHQIPTMIEFGAGEVQTINGDPNSMHYVVNENNGDDTPAKFFQIVETGGPGGTSLSEQFKTLLIARAVVKRQGEGKDTPLEVTPQYIQNAEALALQYPVLEDAYGRYQRFNRKLIKAAMDSGFISQETFEAYTDDMNYYSMYREVGGDILAPQPYGSIGKAVKIKAFKGSEEGSLIADPMVAMIRNMSFWTGAIMRNIAAQKAHRVAMEAGIGRNLLWQGDKLGWQSPDTARGEDERFMSYRVNGTEVRYAVTDALFATGLSNAESTNMSFTLELLGLPTTALREMVTRDPGFMIANLLRDSISTWILAGSGASPLSTFLGMKKALMKDSSYLALKRMAVVGSYDEAQKSPKQMVAGLRANIVGAQGMTNGMDVLKWGWDRLGKLSDASDAATRIAVYEAAIKEGATEYTAAYRALSIMNFSRRGASSGLATWTRLVPFLNARIQGFDVLYTGIKSAVQLASGAEQTAFEKQRGAAVWYRGMGLMAGALALAMLNEDDEEYKQIPQYIKDANFLIPLGGGKFASIPKPFEAGLIFGTVPTTLYDIMRGNRSTRSGIKLFTSQIASTFGFNPMPQVALPIFENLTNSDFYTGQPLISPGMQKLDPSLQYNASTSYVARGLGKLLSWPFGYDFESGKFEDVSPIMIDNLITGYGGPIAGYVSMGIGGLTAAFGEDNQGIPVAGSNLPVIRRFFLDAQDKQPQAAAEAYELYQLVDKATRTASRLKKMGDVEALKEFREENVDILRLGKQVRKMAENLNNIRAQVRRLEVNTTMSGSEKKEKMRELRARELQVSKRVYEINQKLGR